VWLPVLVERFKADPDKWRSLMQAVLGRVYDADEGMRATIRELMDDSKYDVAFAGWGALIGSASHAENEEESTRLLREGLASKNAEIRKRALSWTGFETKKLEAIPEPFEMLFAEDAEIALEARQQLGMTPEKYRAALAERLWAVVDDPERVAAHVPALRAIGVLHETSAIGHPDDNSDGKWRTGIWLRLFNHLRSGERGELAAAAWPIADDWGDASNTVIQEYAAQIKISQERLAELVALKEAIAAERLTAMGPPQQPTSGGGFF
jgi:hypothetical protein